MQPVRVLITGGAGLIGSHIAGLATFADWWLRECASVAV